MAAPFSKLVERPVGRILFETLIFLALAGLMLAPRLPGLGRFVTADEPSWGKRSATFAIAVSSGDFAHTNLTGHPGVTTMWAGALAYWVKFPEYIRVGQLDLGDTRLLELFQRFGPYPIELLAAARAGVALLCTLTLLLSFYFARRIFGLPLSLAMFVFIAYDPFLTAHARFLHTNGLLASFMTLSILAWIETLRQPRTAPLLVSSAAAGLAILSITPGLMIIPAVGLLSIVSLVQPGARQSLAAIGASARRLVLPLALWGIVLLVTIFLVWPAMWVQPLQTLSGILNYGFSAAQGEIGSAHFVQAYTDDYDPNAKYAFFYPLSFFWRTTPAALIGLLLAGVALAVRRSKALLPAWRPGLFRLLIFVLVYTVLMSLGSKKFDRYYLPVYPALDMLAVAGWVSAGRWLVERFRLKAGAGLQAGVISTVLVLQATGAIAAFPYYNTYYNPLAGGLERAPQVMSVGWGEGLQLAARYLKDQPGIRSSKVISWYTLAFNWYAASLGFQAEPRDMLPDIPLKEYQQADYIVVYINQAQRHTPAELLDYLSTMQPDYVVEIDGVEYAWIYHLPPAQGE